MIDSIGGMRVIVSKMVPAPGWYRKQWAAQIERENLAILCAGGSLGECEATRTYNSGVWLVNPPGRDDFLFFSHRDHSPHFLVHPTVKRELDLVHERSMARFAVLQTA
jgi:hypothetical protein